MIGTSIVERHPCSFVVSSKEQVITLYVLASGTPLATCDIFFLDSNIRMKELSSVGGYFHLDCTSRQHFLLEYFSYVHYEHRQLQPRNQHRFTDDIFICSLCHMFGRYVVPSGRLCLPVAKSARIHVLVAERLHLLHQSQIVSIDHHTTSYKSKQ